MADARTPNQSSPSNQAEPQRGNAAQGQLARREENRGQLTPFGFMRRFSEDMDRLFDDFLANPFGFSREGQGLLSRMGAVQNTWTPNIEVFQRDSDLVVRAELPGLTKDDVQVEINDDGLTIQGEKRQEREENRRGVYHSERSYGSFYRSIPLPEGTITDSAQATFKNGVLEITMQAPPSQSRKGHRVDIRDTSNEAATGQKK